MKGGKHGAKDKNNEEKTEENLVNKLQNRIIHSSNSEPHMVEISHEENAELEQLLTQKQWTPGCVFSDGDFSPIVRYVTDRAGISAKMSRTNVKNSQDLLPMCIYFKLYLETMFLRPLSRYSREKKFQVWCFFAVSLVFFYGFDGMVYLF